MPSIVLSVTTDLDMKNNGLKFFKVVRTNKSVDRHNIKVPFIHEPIRFLYYPNLNQVLEFYCVIMRLSKSNEPVIYILHFFKCLCFWLFIKKNYILRRVQLMQMYTDYTLYRMHILMNKDLSFC